MILVVDASVAAMWFLPEEHSANAAWGKKRQPKAELPAQLEFF